MNTIKDSAQVDGMRVRLSTLWLFLLFNMVFADIFSFMYPGSLEQIMAGSADGTTVTPELLLIAAMVTEISIAMILLSRFLKPAANRWANLICGVITILWVIGGGSLTLPYIWFASIEVVSAFVIIWLAWKWRIPEAQPARTLLEPIGSAKTL